MHATLHNRDLLTWFMMCVRPCIRLNILNLDNSVSGVLVAC